MAAAADARSTCISERYCSAQECACVRVCMYMCVCVCWMKSVRTDDRLELKCLVRPFRHVDSFACCNKLSAVEAVLQCCFIFGSMKGPLSCFWMTCFPTPPALQSCACMLQYPNETRLHAVSIIMP
eukprot:scaffold58113_cov22-Tisochrysis_lutea.AAC.2